MKESMSSHSSRESLNSRESKENTPRHSRESTPQHQIKPSADPGLPEFKKPQPVGIKTNKKREEMGVLGHNNNSNIKSNNDLGGSCGSLSSNHSTGTDLSRIHKFERLKMSANFAYLQKHRWYNFCSNNTDLFIVKGL